MASLIAQCLYANITDIFGIQYLQNSLMKILHYIMYTLVSGVARFFIATKAKIMTYLL